MVAITLKETLVHWVRLFGYFLGVAVVGGAVAGGGLALLEDVPNWAPGGAAPDVSIKLIAGAGLLALGALVLLAGFFTIVLVVVATGVRYGVEAAGDDADGDRDEDESADEPVPDPAERLASRRRARRAPIAAHAEPTRPQERAESESSAGPATEHPDNDATDRGEDWMREVERDLVEEEAETASQTAPSDESIVSSDGVDRPPEDETGPTEERAEPSADDWVGADEIGSDDSTADGDAVSGGSQPTGRDIEDEGTDVAPGSDEPPADVADESDVPAGDRPSTASDDPVDEAIDATDESTVSEDASDPGREREPTDPADDPLAPDDFEPEPDEDDPGGATGVEEAMGSTDAEDATEPTDEETDWDDDSTDSDDEPR